MAHIEPAVKVLIDKATALEKQGKTEEARKIYQQALAQAQDPFKDISEASKVSLKIKGMTEIIKIT